MIYATTREEIEARRKAFIRKGRLKHRAVADSLEEAGDRLFTDAGIPGPVSWEATANEPSSALTLIVTSPESVNLIPLPTRLSRTCVRRRPSPRPRGRSGATSGFSSKGTPSNVR
jgi:hypothetical protein